MPVLSGVDEVLARIDQVIDDNSGEPGDWPNRDVLELLAQLRHGLTNAPEWSQVIESNLRAQLAAAEKRARTLAVELDVERQIHEEAEAADAAASGYVVKAQRDERIQTDLAAELFHAALRQVEGERDRARATAARLEQELAETSSRLQELSESMQPIGDYDDWVKP